MRRKLHSVNANRCIRNGTNTTRTMPTTINLGHSSYATKVSVGIVHSCAITNDNTLKCWGSFVAHAYQSYTLHVPLRLTTNSILCVEHEFVRS